MPSTIIGRMKIDGGQGSLLEEVRVVEPLILTL